MIREKDLVNFLSKRNCTGTYIVGLMYKYDFEKEYTESNEIISYDGSRDYYEYLNDWNEGHDDCWVTGVMDNYDVDLTEGFVIPSTEGEPQ